jgi:hypothetical protein
MSGQWVKVAKKCAAGLCKSRPDDWIDGDPLFLRASSTTFLAPD